MYYFVHDTIQDTFCSLFTEFMLIVHIHWHSPLHIGHIVIRLYRVARETGQFQALVPNAQDNKLKKYRQQPLFVSPPRDVYLSGNQAQHTLVIQNDSLPAPSSVK